MGPSWTLQVTFGGDNRARTDDPLLAKQVLSQLSYTPVVVAKSASLGFEWLPKAYTL